MTEVQVLLAMASIEVVRAKVDLEAAAERLDGEDSRTAAALAFEVGKTQHWIDAFAESIHG